MSLDVFIQPTPKYPSSGGTHVHSFDDDEGEYWFLHPLFETLNAQTGQYIDLYGLACFEGDNLDALEKTIASARQLTQAQTDEWDVVTAIELGKPPREIRATLNKQKVISLLDNIQSAIDQARETNWYVVFCGD